MAEEFEGEVCDGSAVFTLIPAELGVSPLLLAVLHAFVFLEGSEQDVVDPRAAEEALHYLANYLQRLDGRDLERVRLDLAVLADFAKREKWPKQNVLFLKSFLSENGVQRDEEA
jgi:hypothetical protein